MRGYTPRKRQVAVGTVNKGKPKKPGYGVYFRDTSVRLDMETFEEVRQRAMERGNSFGAEIRSLIEIGLETLKADESTSGQKLR